MAKNVNQIVAEATSTENRPATKATILSQLAEMSGVSKKQIDQILFEYFPKIIQNDLKKEFPFTLPGLLKIIPVTKPATPEREGKNPFTKELTVFKAKPAYKTVRVKALKKLKEMADSAINK